MKLGVILAVLCTLLPLAGQIYGDRAGGWLMVDFRAYYCGSSALAQHRDPYTVDSLHPCESRLTPGFYRAPPSVTVPAPYPPYALAFLEPLTAMPFAAAAALWWIVVSACILLSAWALGRVTRQPFLIPWACLALSLGLTSVPSGNVLPVCVAALVVAALCVQRGYFAGAAGAIAIAMVEPHVALPAAIAAFACYPRIRVALSLLFALVGAVSLISGGIAENLAYFSSVLPAHALSEVSRDNQYSLSTIVAALGVSDANAVMAGGISYAIAVAAGLAIALRLARERRDPALTLLIPPALALLGGSFAHTPEIAAAVPACLLLLFQSEEHRRWLFAALILFAVPWMMATSAALFLAPLFPVAYLTYALWGRNRTLALAAALSATIAIVLLYVLAAHSPIHAIVQQQARPPIDPRLAEAGWRAFVLGNSTNRPVTWLLRLPTWIGLIVLAVASIAFSLQARLKATLLQPAQLLPVD